jgi:hypothetical protein
MDPAETAAAGRLCVRTERETAVAGRLGVRTERETAAAGRLGVRTDRETAAAGRLGVRTDRETAAESKQQARAYCASFSDMSLTTRVVWPGVMVTEKVSMMPCSSLTSRI